jgi:DNA-binding NarL/FixJ family response regulator
MSDPTHDELQARAVLAQERGGIPVSLAALWRELTSGVTRVVFPFFTERHCYLVLTRCDDAAPQTVSPELLKVLDAVLAGGAVKSAAYELEVCSSTVSQSASAALRQFGLDCTSARVPVLVALAAHVARKGDMASQAMSAEFTFQDRTYRTVWTERLEDRLACVLTTAEHAVVRGLVEGHAHSTIAQRRGTSERTVANQVGAAFRRLGISGRGSLVQYLVCATSDRRREAGM